MEECWDGETWEVRLERGEGGAEGGGCGGRDALGEDGKSGRVKRANGK